MKRLPRPVGRSLKIEELLDWLKALHPSDRRFAAFELGKHEDLGIIEPLIKALGDPEPGVRSAAADSLGRLGRELSAASVARGAVERLVALLEDEDEEVVASAVYALGELGDSSIGPKLLPFLEYPSKPHLKMRNVAIMALRTLRYQPAIPHFRRLISDPDIAVRGDALMALFSMRQVNTDVEEILQSLLDGLDAPLRKRAQIMLEIIADDKQSE